MARKKNTGTNEKNNRYNMTGNFAKVVLTKDMKDAFLAWKSEFQGEDVELLSFALDDSYRVSFKFDYNNRCYMCTFTQQDPKHRNWEIVLVSRSDDPFEALLMNVYKVNVLYPNDPLPTEDEDSTWG